MFVNYIKVALKVFEKNKLFSLLNVLSLALGMACCIVIFLFVKYEFSYDTQLDQQDNIYRIQRSFFDASGSTVDLATTAPKVGPLLQQDFPEVLSTTRLRIEQAPIAKDRNIIFEKYIGWVDVNFFEFFQIDFVYGQPEQIDLDPTSVALSRSAAQRYFGEKNPIGDTILLNGELELQVVAVFEDFPQNSHMLVDVLMTIDLVEPIMGMDQLESWGANSYYTYFKTAPGTDINNLVQKLPDFLIKHFNKKANESTSLPVIKMTDIHLYSHNQNEIKQNGSITTTRTFIVIAIFALLVACINFMNLSTARSLRRAKEIGVRKAIGAKVGQLIWQFLLESILLSLVAMFIAFMIVEISIPFFAAFLQRDLGLYQLYNVSSFLTLVAFVICVGVLAGSYPAFGLAKFDPVHALKGQTKATGASGLVRKTLVVVQFSISICLIVASFVVYQQVQYARNIDIGYDRHHKIVVELPYGLAFDESYLPFKSEIQRHHNVGEVTVSSDFPTNQLLDGGAYFKDGAVISPEEVINLRNVRIDYEFFESYQVQLVAGRYFLEDFNDRLIRLPNEANPNGSANIIINESAMRAIGFASADEAIGKELVQPLDDALSMFIRYPIVGVVKDFYFSSLHTAVQPVVFTPMTDDVDRYITISVREGTTEAALPVLRSAWQTLFPEYAFSPLFLDQQYHNLYNNESRQAKLLAVFAGLTIVVAIMGLYGLAAYSTERRSKELSIRKVHGAKSLQIMLIVSVEFLKLIMIATVFAWPLAFWFMHQWLGQFANAVSLTLLPFAVSTLAALFVAAATTMLQTYKIASSRPVKYLRYE